MLNIALLPYADSRRAVSVRKSDRVRSDSPWSTYTGAGCHLPSFRFTIYKVTPSLLGEKEANLELRVGEERQHMYSDAI